MSTWQFLTITGVLWWAVLSFGTIMAALSLLYVKRTFFVVKGDQSLAMQLVYDFVHMLYLISVVLAVAVWLIAVYVMGWWLFWL